MPYSQDRDDVRQLHLIYKDFKEYFILNIKHFNLAFLIPVILGAILSHNAAAHNDNPRYPLYAGLIGGVGSTTWDGLVPAKENQNLALMMSTPTQVQEGGPVWGVFMGYELFKYFALEVNYIKYPHAIVHFDPMSIFSAANDDEQEFTTHAETVNLSAKVMVPIPHTTINIYSTAGVARLHREDILIDHWRVTPAFGFGLNHDFTPHIMGDIGANYTAGFGDAQLSPSDTYYPFLYSGFVRLAYRV